MTSRSPGRRCPRPRPPDRPIPSVPPSPPAAPRSRGPWRWRPSARPGSASPTSRIPTRATTARRSSASAACRRRPRCRSLVAGSGATGGPDRPAVPRAARQDRCPGRRGARDRRLRGVRIAPLRPPTAWPGWSTAAKTHRPPRPSSPRRDTGRLRAHDLLVWMADRAWLDHWYGEDPAAPAVLRRRSSPGCSTTPRGCSRTSARPIRSAASSSSAATASDIENSPDRLVVTSELAVAAGYRVVDESGPRMVPVPPGIPVVRPRVSGPLTSADSDGRLPRGDPRHAGRSRVPADQPDASSSPRAAPTASKRCWPTPPAGAPP